MTTIDPTYRPATAVAAASSSATNPSSVASVLPDPDEALALSGDPVVALAQLAVKNGNDQRDVAEKAREADEQAEHTQDELEVQAMREKAGEIRSAGYIEGAGTMLEGGIGFCAADKILDNGTPSPEGNRWKAAAIFVHASVEIHSGESRADEAGCDANSAAHRAAADQAKSAADDMHDAKKDAADYISAALDFYREYTSAKASEAGATLHRG
jgi:hypothetical protein